MNKKVLTLIGFAIFGGICIYLGANSSDKAGYMGAVAFLMVFLWITEALPIPVTALLPIIFFPLFGISKAQDTASEYFNSTILIFLGGFLLALTMEKWELHKRISLLVIKFIGTSPYRIILGFMTATAMISSVLSNVATTSMMFPIALALVIKLTGEKSDNNTSIFATALMLSIAYSASIGGIATLIGTAPNLAFQRVFEITFPNGPKFSFANWLVFGIPISIIMLISTWFILIKVAFRVPKSLNLDSRLIDKEYRKLGKITYEELIVGLVLSITGLLWLFRIKIDFGSFVIQGWSEILPFSKYMDDSTVAIAMAFILFLIPSKSGHQKIANVELFNKVPWDIIILFGGGFALAMGFESSGLSLKMGEVFKGLGNVNPIILIIIVCFVLTFLTEMTSNTATTYTVLPILASISIGMGVNPLIMMLPATISASFAFMLPVATPPNAIVYSSGYIKMKDMVKAGLYLNFVGIIVVTLIFLLISFPILGIDIYEVPKWLTK